MLRTKVKKIDPSWEVIEVVEMVKIEMVAEAEGFKMAQVSIGRWGLLKRTWSR